MTLAYGSNDLLNLVDPARGLVDRRIFHDEDLYQLELEHVFARAWNFMCHDTQIPNPGDFFMTFIGEDRVIVVRDNDGMPQVLVNSCRHRGNAVCRAEEGHATSFMCTYHGWTYDLKGALVGVPGFKEVYHEELNRENWGLIKAGKVDSYKGFIFANMDPEAPELDDYLGDVGRMGIEGLAARGNLICAPGVQKWTIGCNWKFAADNIWDYYHGGVTHASASQGGWTGRLGMVRDAAVPPPRISRYSTPHRIVLGEYGHALGGPRISDEQLGTEDYFTMDSHWRDQPGAREALGPVGLRAGGHPGIFPNLWIMQGHTQISLRLPKGPTTTEIWWFTFTYEGMTPELRQHMLTRAVRHNGPAGVTEIDDGENWGESTRGTRGVVGRNYPLHYAMHQNHGDIASEESGPGYIDTPSFSEHAQLWFYRSWSEWMAASNWSDLKAHHSEAPKERM